MEIVYSDEELMEIMGTAVKVSKAHPVLIDKYLTHALEIDVDAVCDGERTYVGGVLEHVEFAGVHSGDASMVLPPQSLSKDMLDRIDDITARMAVAVGTKGLINLQLAVKDDEIYVIEANPRASRTVPFISKATGVSLAKLATKVMLGHRLDEYKLPSYRDLNYVTVKSSVFPFDKLKGVDAILGPEMKSTGEIMGIDQAFGMAFYKAQLAAGCDFRLKNKTVYVTVKDADQPLVVNLCQRLYELGVKFYGTKGTASMLRENRIPCETVYFIREDRYPDAIGLMRSGTIDLVVNTPSAHSGSKRDGFMMRRVAVDLHIPYITTISGFRAAVDAIEALNQGAFSVRSLNEYHKGMGSE
jgi:carbamoyl-phosphate synthase large subunit